MKKTAVSDDEPIVWLSTKDASELLGISFRTLYQLIDDGHLPFSLFKRALRLQKHHVIGYLDRHPKTATSWFRYGGTVRRT